MVNIRLTLLGMVKLTSTADSPEQAVSNPDLRPIRFHWDPGFPPTFPTSLILYPGF